MSILNAGKIYAEKLKLSETTGSVVTFCPFHNNTETPSFSVNLDKAVHFCHGGCDEPKGGGIVEFLIKWARTEGKTITRREAQRQLHRTFSVPNAKTLLREAAEENIRLFAFYMPHMLGDILREFDREIDLINEMWSAWPVSPTRKWARLEEIHKLRPIYEWGFETCLTASKRSTDELAAVYSFFTSIGLWDSFSAETARETQRQRHALNRRRIARRPVRTPVQTEKGDPCRATRSLVTTTTTPNPKRSPVLPEPQTSTMSRSKRSPVK